MSSPPTPPSSGPDTTRVDLVSVAVEAGARNRSLRELPRLVLAALALVWRAGKATTVLVLGAQVITSLSVLLQIVLIKRALDVLLASDNGAGSIRGAFTPVVLLAVLAALTTTVTTISGLQRRVLGDLVDREVWRELFDVSGKVDLTAYEDADFYDQAQRVRLGSAQRTLGITQGLVGLIGGGLGVLAGAVAVTALSPELLPLLFVSGLPLWLTSRASGRREFAFSVKQSPAYRERAYLQTVLTGRDDAKEVRAFGMAAALIRRWEVGYRTYLQELRVHVWARTRLTLTGGVSSAVLTGITLVLVLLLVQADRLTLAAATAALVAVRLLGGRLVEAFAGLGSIYESALFLQDVQGFRHRGEARKHDGLPAPAQFDEVVVDDAVFTYPHADRPTIEGVTIRIRRGEVVALVGENGSGKTTVAKLLAGLYEPQAGAVRWDDVDIRDLDRADLAKRMAVIFQDFTRFRLSARDNITLGLPDDFLSDAQVIHAARQAGAHDFINRLPNGYETRLSKEFQGGTDLSLGQWQRVALARAFVRNAPLVILDEPSASLDARAEHDLFTRVRSMLTGRTVLLISHRFSTVRSADRIYVLSGGRVIEEGRHEELMARRGHYADLFELQASAYTSPVPTKETH